MILTSNLRTSGDTLAALEALAIPTSAWNHRAHVRSALACLEALPLDEAIARFRAAVKGINRKFGYVDTPTGGYHETLTKGFLLAIARYLEALPPGLGSLERQASVVAAFSDAKALLRFYSRDRLASLEARQGWLAPDLQPLDAPPSCWLYPADGTFDATVDACLARLQDDLRAYEWVLLPGETMAAGYHASLREACAAREGCIYMVEDAQGIGGLICVWIDRDFEPLETSQTTIGYISDIVVLPTHRGKGLGRVLLAAAEEHVRARGVFEVQLAVLESNVPARSLYDASGYQDYRRLMRKAL